MNTRNFSAILALSFILILVDSPFASGKGDTFTPIHHPTLHINKARGEISIDGSLEDPGWDKAALATGFVEHMPGDQTRPAVETVARVTYDENNFYVSCICYDEPDEIRATFCDRDQLVGNDVIILLIDTYAEATWAYNLYVNPLGVQTDALWQPTGSDFGYNVIYESAGRITDSGYQVEISIPFSSLHFPSHEAQTWKFNIHRIRPRESWFEYSWAAYDRNDPCTPCQWGSITGLQNVRPAEGVEIIPSAIGYQFGNALGARTPEDPYRFVNYDPDGEMAINAKYKPLSNISLEATINPDFSQIEPDAAQVDVNTTSALFFPERRPFFQEARELFYTWSLVYYSRMINDPRAAFKGAGKIGKSSFGYLFANDEHSPFILPFEDASANLTGGESFSNVVRFRHTFGQDTYGGLLVTDRRFEGGGSGTVVNFDGELRLHENWRSQVQLMGSYVVEPDDAVLNEQIGRYLNRGWIDSTFDGGKYTSIFDNESYYGHYLVVNLEERSRHFDFDLGYLEASPTYRSDLGFQRTGNWRDVEFAGDYTFYYDDRWLERLVPNFGISTKWNFDGRKKYQSAELGLDLETQGQVNISTSYQAGSETFRNIEFDDIWLLSLGASKTFSEKLFVRALADYGRQISRLHLLPGKQTSINLYAYIRPNDRLQIEPDYDYIKSIHAEDNSTLYEGYIFWTRIYYHFSREFNIRLIVQYDDLYETLNVDPLITYRINPFTVFYLGTTYEYCKWISSENGYDEKNTYLNKRQFFVKLQYMFRF